MSSFAGCNVLTNIFEISKKIYKKPLKFFVFIKVLFDSIKTQSNLNKDKKTTCRKKLIKICQ